MIIRKNSKQHKDILSKAKDILAFSENYSTNDELVGMKIPQEELVEHMEFYPHARIYDKGNNKFFINIYSDLWYNFSV